MASITEALTAHTDRDSLRLRAPRFSAFGKARCALKVFAELASATGKEGSARRQDILQNVVLLSNVREMLENPSVSRDLRELALRLVGGFALDHESRNCGATRMMVTVLLAVFICRGREGDGGDLFQLAAGRALVRLTMESEPNCKAIAMGDENNLESLRSMALGGQPSTAHGVVAANVLRNLCAYLEPADNRCQEDTTMKKFAGANILTVLAAICQIEEEHVLGEDTEAFLGLALQFGKLICGTEFGDALNADAVGPGNFVQKLVSVLSQANARPAADRRPGTRRSAIELTVWMLRSERQLDCIQHFVSSGMRDALTTAKQQVSVEENYKLLAAAGVHVLLHDESLSALVKTALRLLPAAS